MTARPIRSGGFGGFSGHFTQTGRAIAIYYAAVFVLGAILTNWTSFGGIWESLVLYPVTSTGFAIWQPLTHVLVYFPLQLLQIAIDLFVFWLFAYQVEWAVGRPTFLFLVFGIPLIAGLVGLPFTAIPLLGAPFAGFSVVLDVLVVAFCMMNRSAIINFMFVLPVNAAKLIWVLVGVHAFMFFPMRQNPWVVYQLVAIGLAVLMFRYDVMFDPEGWRLRWKARKLKKKQSRLSVIPGGRDDDDDRGGTLYH